ncbi:SAM pointed domain-containing Ets transcription factor-like [Pollicipes pollicipes]|uniref:SAM pointed domain-containing Ets transcription factor-like n=1 Tax=Pollicipes pollicipes TaxID=41117 RepID=UPI0018852784|nr:SAM pointed domain-containing Ets transcription factor-like [Pollicipes pollicipes]
MMSQTVPNYDCGPELASSLAELDFSILSDYQVPSPSSLPTYERSPPHLFGSPPRESADGDWDCRGESASPAHLVKQEMDLAAVGGRIKQEFGPADSCLSLADMSDDGGRTPRSPFSDGGYSSQGCSPSSQPDSPPPPFHGGFHHAASPPPGYGCHPASPPASYGAGCPPCSPPAQDHQTLRQCLRGAALPRRLNMPALGLDLLGSEGGAQPGNGWMLDQLAPVLDLALEQMRQEKKNVCMLLGIPPDPSQWTVEQVRAWVAYTCQQFRLPPPPLDWLTVDGQTLCSLSEQQFSMYAPQCGETLLAQLEVWRADHRRPGPLPWPVKQEPLDMAGDAAADSGDAPDSDDEDDKSTPVRSGSHIHLWQFLKELLTHPQLYGSSIRWIDRQAGIFKIEDSVRVAKLWGKRKNRPAMNYDKLSRSIRQYYKKGMMKKTERSQRLVYQFCHPYSL